MAKPSCERSLPSASVVLPPSSDTGPTMATEPAALPAMEPLNTE